MKNLFGRTTFYILMMIVQIVLLALSIVILNEHFYFVYAIILIIDIVLIIYICNKPDDSSYKLSWIIIICILPLFGGIAYLYLNLELKKAFFILLQKRSIKNGSYHLSQSDETFDKLKSQSIDMSNTARYLNKWGGYPVYENTSVKYYSVGELQFEDMLIELEKAKHFIFMEFFIIKHGYMYDKIADILKRKAKAGVEVRFMYDGVGTQIHVPKKFFNDLKESGVKCKIFSPFTPFISTVQNNRDHRKILVIDGNTAFTGGSNIADEYINRIERFGHWKDTGVMLKGEAVLNFTVMFLQLWDIDQKDIKDYSEFIDVSNFNENIKSDGFVQPFSDSPSDNEPVGRSLYIDIINNAKDFVYVTTPYLIPDENTINAFILAAKKGVDVRIITPHIPDKKYAYSLAWNYYPELIRAGVKIYEYTPGFIHAKNFVSDNSIAVVGTINLDYRSLFLHFECACVMYNCSAINDIKSDFLETQALSQEITLELCSKRPLIKRMLGCILRMFAPLI